MKTITEKQDFIGEWTCFICGNKVTKDNKNVIVAVPINNKHFYFCSKPCQKDLKKYLKLRIKFQSYEGYIINKRFDTLKENLEKDTKK